MDFSFPTLLIVPLALGLLGFVEPCTVGGHLIFLRTLTERSLPGKAVATLTFALIRTVMMGLAGALATQLGQHVVNAQTTLWLMFGALYVLIGIAYALGQAQTFKHRIDIAPASWKAARNPLVLGVAFGLNIPACAAPVLFALIGLAASSGAVTLGFATMAIFGLALSLPLALFVASPRALSLAIGFMTARSAIRWVFVVVFLALGAWSIWFGLFVDPADWSRI